MQLQLRRIWALPLLCCFLFGNLSAQEVLTSDAAYPLAPMVSVQRQVVTGSGLRTSTLTLPFFDDFSAGLTLPDTNRWAIHPLDLRRPTISIEKGENLRSKGVATFDGANRLGRKYASVLATGEGDTLASQPFDLSTYSPADSLYLSFFVQRGGNGESPESSDSLVVFFDTTGNFEYKQVWALQGLGAAEADFQLYWIPLNEAVFFNTAFRFKFANYGSLNGELDQFHLDYVMLGAQRSALNTQFSDVSVIRVAESPFYPYTAVPRKQLQRGLSMTNTQTLVANVGSPASSANLSLSIDDPVGANVFSGTTIVSANSPSLAVAGNDMVSGGSFSSQSTTLLSYGAMRMTAHKTSPGDQHPENDSVSTTYRVDSILGIDDGVSDFGYGLTTARAFCQKYEIDQPDTLVAVWIHFAPTMHYNPTLNLSTDLDGKGFRLVVWDTLSVDSSLLETSGGMNVNYGSSANEFIRYQLIREVEVPATFYVGLRQTDGMAIGVGFDRNNSEQRIYYENANAQFQLSNNKGSLMIRPEFKVPDAFVSVESPKTASQLRISVVPNPIEGSQIGLQLLDASQLRTVSCALMDVQGRILQTWEHASTASIQLSLNQRPASGVYWLRIQAIDLRGNAQWSNLKVVLR